MFLTTTINKLKLIQALAYIASRSVCTDIYHMVKILYFADKSHMQTYGRFICGSTYARMGLGPVPSEAYDILKYLSGKPESYFVSTNREIAVLARESISAEERDGYPCFRLLGNLDMEVFSKSDLKCLNAAIEEIGPLTFEQLKEKSHDQVWEVAGNARVHFIPLELFVSALPNGNDLSEFLAQRA